MCGHRLRNHGPALDHSCNEKKCVCKGFYYIPSEGSWMLRCRCKRKAVEHEPLKPYKSIKPPLNGVICTGFYSPWVCNCGCPWSNHTQRFEEMKISAHIISAGVPLEMIDEGGDLAVLDAGIKRGGVAEFLSGQDIHRDEKSTFVEEKISDDFKKSFSSNSDVTTTVSLQRRNDEHDNSTGRRQIAPRVISNFNSSSDEAKENVLKKLNQKMKMMRNV